MKHLLTLLSFCVGACSGQMESKSNPSGEPGERGGEASQGTVTAGGTKTVGGGGRSSTAPTAGGVAGKAGTEVELTPEQLTNLMSMACSGWSYEPEPLPNYISLLVDSSESIDWVKTTDAIDGTIGRDALQAFPQATYLELRSFPIHGSSSGNVAACVATTPEVPFTYLDRETGILASAIHQVLSSTVPSGRSPTLDAYNATVQSFTTSSLPGALSILLVTDGFPSLDASCQEPCTAPTGCKRWWDAASDDSLYAAPEPIVEAIDSAWKSHGIRTFVVQVGANASPRPWMTEAAIRGHTGKPGCDPTAYDCHIDLNVQSLAQQLHEAWLQSQPNCVYFIPDTSADGMITIDPTLITPVVRYSDGRITLLTLDSTTTPTCEKGFRFTADRQLEICRSTCAAISDPTNPGTLEVMFGCSSSPIDIPLD